MPKIPVNIDEMFTELPDLDEGIPYRGIVRGCRLADEPDKNGRNFVTGLMIEVTEPHEFKGRMVSASYLPIVHGKPGGTFDIMFPRFLKAFKVPVGTEFDPQDAIGCEGEFTVKNEEYQGQSRPRVKDFLM